MLVKATGKPQRKLEDRGFARVLVDIVFLPQCDGDAISQRWVTLVKK
jgi:hypothetical protein